MTALPDLDTPAAVVDLDRVEANLARAQAYADSHGLRLRPHVKTHKLPALARRQVALGAVGITCQKLGEAEAMADGGLREVLSCVDGSVRCAGVQQPSPWQPARLPIPLRAHSLRACP